MKWNKAKKIKNKIKKNYQIKLIKLKNNNHKIQ